jgi:type IV secretory pathway VirB10-like protein
MEISKAAVGILAAVCLTAGAGGAYLATRTEPAPPPEAIATAGEPSAQPGVEQSEAIVAEPAAIAPEAPVAAPAPPVIDRTAPPARRTDARQPRSSARPQRPIEAVDSYPEARVLETPSVMPPALEPIEPPRVAEAEPFEPPPPPAPRYEDLVVAADSVIGLQVETAVTSERARIEDEVVAHVTRDVKVGDRVAIPAGSKAYGEVTLVERGGKMRDKARLGVRFTSVVLGDGTRVDLDTDTIIREGSAPGGESAAKIGGGAIGGAIIGGILGGTRGAIIGGSAGAGAGSAAVLAGGRNPATLPSGAPITVRLLRPTTVTVEK